MEERASTRNRWVVVVVVGALAVLCCCLVLVVAGAVGWFTGFPTGWSWGPGVDGEEVVQTYGVGRTPALVIDSFAGNITVRAGEGEEIQVRYVKHAPRTSDLDRIEVDIRPRAGGLTIVTRYPGTLVMNSSVVCLQTTSEYAFREWLNTIRNRWGRRLFFPGCLIGAPLP